jgi:hypothetical protein
LVQFTDTDQVIKSQRNDAEKQREREKYNAQELDDFAHRRWWKQ